MMPTTKGVKERIMTTHHSTHGARLRAGGWMLVIAALLLPSVVHAQVV